MFLASPQLRVIHVSSHVSLQEAIERVTRERVLEAIVAARDACHLLGIRRPRIGAAGLNPHAGEAGSFGRRDSDEILPAVVAARARGIDASDPQLPDTVFLRAVRGEFDIVGSGSSSPRSHLAAIYLAAKMATAPRRAGQ